MTRTPEQITAQLRARLAEMEAEAKLPKWQTPCKTCRWASANFCEHPLIIGLEKRLTWTWDHRQRDLHNSLCGEEKALWEPKKIRHRWDRNSEWAAFLFGFFAPIAFTFLVVLILRGLS